MLLHIEALRIDDGLERATVDEAHDHCGNACSRRLRSLSVLRPSPSGWPELAVHYRARKIAEPLAVLLERDANLLADRGVPDAIAAITRASERMHALLRAEMDRLSADPRHFRLLLDY